MPPSLRTLGGAPLASSVSRPQHSSTQQTVQAWDINLSYSRLTNGRAASFKEQAVATIMQAAAAPGPVIKKMVSHSQLGLAVLGCGPSACQLFFAPLLAQDEPAKIRAHSRLLEAAPSSRKARPFEFTQTTESPEPLLREPQES